jgi:hypothetical protein
VYCPNPTLARPKVDMTPEHFERAIRHANRFYRNETQFELNLAGIGESTLHPLFPELIGMVREFMPAIRIVFATNGINLSSIRVQRDKVTAQQAHAGRVLDALVKAKKTGEVHVYVSLHRPERAGLAIEVLREAGLLAGVSADPSLEADDWAGQVKWKRSFQQRRVCDWLKEKRVIALADGRISTCCLDASGVGVIGHVSDEPESWNPKPFSLCGTCQYATP